MADFEYSKWDGSQAFQAQSADKLFEQIADYMMQYGEHVLRNLDDLDNDDAQDLLEQIQKAGLIEEDGEGRWQVTPKGLRKVQESALTSLFQTFQRDAVGKHDTAQKGSGSIRLEDSALMCSVTRSPTSTCMKP